MIQLHEQPNCASMMLLPTPTRSSKLSPKLISSLTNSRPRPLSNKWGNTWFVYTDASFQPSQADWPCGLGGVLIAPNGQNVSAFSFTLNLSSLEVLGYPKKRTAIFEAELLAILVGVSLWGKIIKGLPCVFYVDKNSARDVSISGHARTFPGNYLAQLLLQLEDDYALVAWYARVPSESNVADGPLEK